MNSTTSAVDVAKSVFEVAVSQQPDEVRGASPAFARAFPAFPGRATAGDGAEGGADEVFGGP